MSTSQLLGPLERTFNLTKPELVQQIAETVGVDQQTSRNLTSDTLAEVLPRLGLDVPMRKSAMITRLRRAHPRLDRSTDSANLTKTELREVYASIERSDDLGGERP